MSKTKMYSVLDKWTDLEKENIVDFTSVDGVVTEARVNGVPAGGGGGPITTAEITLNLTPPEGVDLTQVAAANVVIEYPSEDEVYKARTITAVNNKLTVLLYNGIAYIELFFGIDEDYTEYYINTETVTISGDARYDSDLVRFIVTGPCTITGTLDGGGN